MDARMKRTAIAMKEWMKNTKEMEPGLNMDEGTNRMIKQFEEEMKKAEVEVIRELMKKEGL